MKPPACRTTEQRIPTIGEYMVERGGNDTGMVVDVLPSGEMVVLAWPDRTGRIVEKAYATKNLKGLCLGRAVVPGNQTRI